MPEECRDASHGDHNPDAGSGRHGERTGAEGNSDIKYGKQVTVDTGVEQVAEAVQNLYQGFGSLEDKTDT